MVGTYDVFPKVKSHSGGGGYMINILKNNLSQYNNKFKINITTANNLPVSLAFSARTPRL